MWTWGFVHTIFWDKGLKMRTFLNTKPWFFLFLNLSTLCSYTFRRPCLYSMCSMNRATITQIILQYYPIICKYVSKTADLLLQFFVGIILIAWISVGWLTAQGIINILFPLFVVYYLKKRFKFALLLPGMLNFCKCKNSFHTWTVWNKALFRKLLFEIGSFKIRHV